MIAQPLSQRRVPVDELRDALTEVLSRYYGAPAVVRKLKRDQSRYCSSYFIENLKAELSDGQARRPVFKDTSPASAVAFQHHNRPGLVYCPRREIEAYQLILNPDLGPPICYGAVVSGELQRYWLFLERVDGVPLWQMGKIDRWQEAARWLAQLHTRFDLSAAAGVVGQCQHLVQYDEGYFRAWLERAERFVAQRADPPGLAEAKRFERLIGAYHLVIKELIALPKCLVHGEFYPSNVLVRRRPPRQKGGDAPAWRERAGTDAKRERPDICAIDWETAGIGPGLIDVAAMTSGKWSEDAKHLIVTAYWEELGQNRRPALPELMRGIELCQLQLAIQWLGWAESWSPPKQNEQDWLKEALRLAERLGI